MGNTVKIDLAKLREKLSGLVDENHISDIVNSCVVREEAVEHPKHYQGKNECIDVIRAMLNPKEFLGFLKGNSIKYRFRSSMKNGEEDVKKAEWYETRLIEEKTGCCIVDSKIEDIIEYQENLKKSGFVMEKIK